MENYLKTFEQINENVDRISLLENEIIKRDELIYAMMFHLSHGYQSFMIKPTSIDKLREIFTVDDILDKNRKSTIMKINSLHEDII